MSITFTTGTCTIPLSTDGSASDPAASTGGDSAASGGSASAGGSGVNATSGDGGASAGGDSTTAGASRRLQGASASSGGNGNNRYVPHAAKISMTAAIQQCAMTTSLIVNTSYAKGSTDREKYILQHGLTVI
jgi:hypothetical protein